MILRSTKASTSLRSRLFLLPTNPIHRHLHTSLPLPPVPPPTPFVPDAATFLTLIGRSLSAHAAKIPSWDALFSFSSAQLRDLGVEPPRSRRYLLWWRDRFRRGVYGPGGELRTVVDGVAEVRVVEAMPGRLTLVNVPPGTTATAAMEQAAAEKAAAVAQNVDDRGGKFHGGVTSARIRAPGIVVGSGFLPVKGTKGSAARLRVAEGLWEQRRGHKVHGGERRRKNVLSRLAAKERGTLK